MSDMSRGVDRPGGLVGRPQPGATTANEPGELAALIDRVADFWRTASKSASVDFIEQSPARAYVVDGNVVGVITDDPSFETSAMLQFRPDGICQAVGRDRATVTTGAQYSHAIDAVKDIALTLGNNYRMYTGRKMYPAGWSSSLPQGVLNAGADGDAMRLEVDGDPSHFFICSWEPIARSRILTMSLGELSQTLRDTD